MVEIEYNGMHDFIFFHFAPCVYYSFTILINEMTTQRTDTNVFIYI